MTDRKSLIQDRLAKREAAKNAAKPALVQPATPPPTPTEKKAAVKAAKAARAGKMVEADKPVDQQIAEEKVKKDVEKFADKVAKEAAKKKALEEMNAKIQKLLDEHEPETPCELCDDPTSRCQAEQVRILHAQGISIGDIGRFLNIPYHQAYNPIFRLKHPYVGKAKRAEMEAAKAAAEAKPAAKPKK